MIGYALAPVIVVSLLLLLCSPTGGFLGLLVSIALTLVWMLRGGPGAAERSAIPHTDTVPRESGGAADTAASRGELIGLALALLVFTILALGIGFGLGYAWAGPICVELWCNQ